MLQGAFGAILLCRVDVTIVESGILTKLSASRPEIAPPYFVAKITFPEIIYCSLEGEAGQMCLLGLGIGWCIMYCNNAVCISMY